MSYLSTLAVIDLADTTRYILVDKSDGTNFPHTADAALKLNSVTIHLDKEGTGDWVVRVGVVEEVDATNGSVHFFAIWPISGQTSVVNEQIIFQAQSKREFVSTKVVSSADVSGSVNWQTDVNLTNPAGTTTGPGAGDIVAEVEEVDGAATMSFSITVEYSHA